MVTNIVVYVGRASRFGFQHPHGRPKLSITPVPRVLHACGAQIYVQTKYTHKTKYIFKNLSNKIFSTLS